MHSPTTLMPVLGCGCTGTGCCANPFGATAISAAKATARPRAVNKRWITMSTPSERVGGRGLETMAHQDGYQERQRRKHADDGGRVAQRSRRVELGRGD